MSVKTLRDLLGARPLHSVTPETKLREVATVMATHKIGAVAVLDQERFVGILTERDIVFRGVGAGLVVDQACASDVMTVEPVTVDIDDAISDALAAKLGDAFRHLPVTENGIVVGVLSYRDIPAEYVMMFERFREMTTSRADEGV